MHEFTFAEGIIGQVLRLAEEKGALKVHRVGLEIGELAMISEEALRFAYSVLSEEFELLSGSTLDITYRKGVVRCPGCGYSGELRTIHGEGFHTMFPVFTCPECGDRLEVVEGRDSIITNIEMEVSDAEAEGQKDG